MRAIRLTLGILVISIVGSLGIGHAEVVSDAEVSRRWAQLEACAGAPALEPVWGSQFDDPAGESAIKALDPNWYAEPFPMIDAQTLPAPLRAELDTVVNWSLAPQFKPDLRHQSAQTMRVHDRLRMVLATASVKEVVRAMAVLGAAWQLRSKGTLMRRAVGMYVSLDVARWARSRGLQPWPGMRVAAPTAKALQRAFAREAVWVIRAARANPEMAKGLPMPLRQWQLHMHAVVGPICAAEPTFDAIRAAVRQPRESDPPPVRAVLGSYAHVAQLAQRQAAEYQALLVRP